MTRARRRRNRALASTRITRESSDARRHRRAARRAAAPVRRRDRRAPAPARYGALNFAWNSSLRIGLADHPRRRRRSSTTTARCRSGSTVAREEVPQPFERLEAAEAERVALEDVAQDCPSLAEAADEDLPQHRPASASRSAACGPAAPARREIPCRLRSSASRRVQAQARELGRPDAALRGEARDADA